MTTRRRFGLSACPARCDLYCALALGGAQSRLLVSLWRHQLA
jgi:hypothetical protein